MRTRFWVLILVSFSILAPSLLGSIALAGKELGAVSVSQSADEDHCHESESLPQPENDCHCAKHRVSCCHINVFVTKDQDASYVFLVGSLSYEELDSSPKTAPDLDGPFQPPRV